MDTTPPGPLTLKGDGSFNIETAFSCVDVTGIEPLASVFYELTTNGTVPASPTPSSTKLAANAKLCGIHQNGATQVRIVQYDAAGNRGPTTLHHYQLDTTAPEICAASASPHPVAFADLPLHLRVVAESSGTATVEIQGVGTASLKDDGTSGDSVAGDGIYELDYDIPAGADVPSATLTARFADAAGNPASPYVLTKKLFVDRTASKLSGAIVVDTVWTAAGSPYVVINDTAIAGDLSIEPGATVIFKGGSLLAVLGKLTAVGTAAKPIVMHDAWLSLDGEKGIVTFDPMTEAYVAGSRLDYVQMADGELVLEESGQPAVGVYATNSEIGTLTGGGDFQFTFGSYIAKSYIHQVANYTSLAATRITNSHVGNMWINANAWPRMELTYNRIDFLEVDLWKADAILEHCDIGLLRLLRPTAVSPMFFRANNLGVLGVPESVVVLSGEASDPRIDATGNYWGAATTAQMTQLGTAANIGAIKDFFDDIKLPRVDYSGFLSAPAAAGPDWALPEPPSEPGDSCAPGSGGSGGSGGAGTGGAGGSGGSGGVGGSGGSGQLLGACNNAPFKYCSQYSGASSQQSALQTECAQSRSTWQGSCAESNLLGTCTYRHGNAQPAITGVLHYYQGAQATTAQLKSSCESGLGGTWVTK